MEVLLFFVWLGMCALVSAWASSKGRSEFKAFVIAFLLSPLVGFIVVAFLHNKKREERDANLARMTAEATGKATAEALAAVTQDGRPCPKCAETIKKAAVVCRYCGAEVEAAA